MAVNMCVYMYCESHELGQACMHAKSINNSNYGEILSTFDKLYCKMPQQKTLSKV